MGRLAAWRVLHAEQTGDRVTYLKEISAETLWARHSFSRQLNKSGLRAH